MNEITTCLTDSISIGRIVTKFFAGSSRDCIFQFHRGEFAGTCSVFHCKPPELPVLTCATVATNLENPRIQLGSPLVCEFDSEFFIYGIVVRKARQSVIYADIAMNYNWIQSAIAVLGRKPTVLTSFGEY